MNTIIATDIVGWRVASAIASVTLAAVYLSSIVIKSFTSRLRMYDRDKIAAYSTNGGQTWTASVLPSNLDWASVSLAGSLAVAVAQNLGTVAAYSSNGGQTWVAVTMPTSGQWSSVALSGSLGVAVSVSANAAYSLELPLPQTVSIQSLNPTVY